MRLARRVGIPSGSYAGDLPNMSDFSESKRPRTYAHFSDPNDDVMDVEGGGYEWTNPQMSAPAEGATVYYLFT